MRWILPLLACLTLGLAPFFPQPHIIEKVRWLIEGRPFRRIDILDFLFHGAPWLWLAWTLLRRG
jgi:hypothetical protein